MKHYIFVGLTNTTKTFIQAMVSSEVNLQNSINILAAFERVEKDQLTELARISDHIYRKNDAPKFIKEMQYIQILDQLEGGLVDDEEAEEHGIVMPFNPYVVPFDSDEKLVKLLDKKVSKVGSDDELVLVLSETPTPELVDWINQYDPSVIMLTRPASFDDFEVPVLVHAYNVLFDSNEFLSDLMAKLPKDYTRINLYGDKMDEDDKPYNFQMAVIEYPGAHIRLEIEHGIDNSIEYNRMLELYEAITVIDEANINDHVFCEPEYAREELQSFLDNTWKDFYRKDRKTGLMKRA
mgnify:CR=1 FL=1